MVIVIAFDNLFPDCGLQVFPSLYSHMQWCEYSQNVRFNINVMDTSEQVEFWKKYFVMINFFRGEINIVLAFPVAWFALPQVTALHSALSLHTNPYERPFWNPLTTSLPILSSSYWHHLVLNIYYLSLVSALLHVKLHEAREIIGSPSTESVQSADVKWMPWNTWRIWLLLCCFFFFIPSENPSVMLHNKQLSDV